MEETAEKENFYEGFFERNAATTLLLLFLSATTMALGYMYYERTMQDPALCASCHMTKESFTAWQMGGADCLGCHKVSISDRNRYFMAYMSGGRDIIKDKCRPNEKPIVSQPIYSYSPTKRSHL